MAFISPDLAEGVALTSAAANDGIKTTEANLNDGNTSTTAVNEIRTGMSGYKMSHDIGFSVANIATLKVRAFDGVMTATGNAVINPYSSGDAAVVTGNEQNLALIAKSSKHENAKQPHWAQARSSCWGTRSPPL